MLRYILVGFWVVLFLFLGFGRETIITPLIGQFLQTTFDNEMFLQHGNAQQLLPMLLGFVDTLLFALLYACVLAAIIVLIYPATSYRKWAMIGLLACNVVCVGSVLLAKYVPTPTTTRIAKDIQYAYFSPMPLVLLAGFFLLKTSSHH
jgi:hypothetical protein